MDDDVKTTTEAQFRAWLERATPGSSIVCYRGATFLCAARDSDSDLDGLAAAALELETLGRVLLAQRRRGDAFEYIAVKRAPAVPKRPARPMSAGAPVLAQRRTPTISEDRLPRGGD